MEIFVIRSRTMNLNSSFINYKFFGEFLWVINENGTRSLIGSGEIKDMKKFEIRIPVELTADNLDFSHCRIAFITGENSKIYLSDVHVEHHVKGKIYLPKDCFPKDQVKM